jgi:dynein assembly factor with WDR repeat domains 1
MFITSFHFVHCTLISADIDVIVNQIVFEEPLISESKKPHLRRLIYSKLKRTIEAACFSNSTTVYTAAMTSPIDVSILMLFRHDLVNDESPELIEKLESNESSDFFLFKILRAHILPLTNCAFNKSGDKFITGSYDRTCKVWNTISGDELLTLEGHRNVVYAIAFNNPYGDKIITGSFG